MKKKPVDSSVRRDPVRSDSTGVPLVFQLVRTMGVSRQEREEFQEQCRVLQTFSGDVVLPLLGAFPFGDYLLLAHEETSYTSLRQMVGAPLPLHDALLLAEHTARTLGAIHARGIAYKTLTPDTLYVAPHCERVVLGVPHFPVAIGRDETKGAERWAYIAPEQIICVTESEQYIADFYALGIVLYEMLLGHTPLPEGGQVDIFQAHLEGEPLLRVQRLAHIPLCVRQVIAALLAPLPADRYQSAMGILYDIQWCRRIISGQEDSDDFVARSRDISAAYYYSDTLRCDDESTNVLLEALGRIVGKGTAEVLLLTGDNGAGKTTVTRRALAQYPGEVRVAYFPVPESNGNDTRDVLQQLLLCINKSAAMPSIPSGRQGAGRTMHREKKPFAEAQEKDDEGALPLATKRAAGQNFLSIVQEATENSDATKADIEFLLCQSIAVLAGGRSVAAVVIDNIHHASAAFMQVLMACISRSRMLPVLFICIADNKFAVSLLPDYLRTLAYQDIPVGTTALSPLEVEHICQLIADTFGASFDGTELLAELTYRQTSGNPKALRAFWDALVTMQVLRFSFGHWQCDMIRLRDMQVAGSLSKVLAAVSEHVPYRVLGDLLTALAVDDMVQSSIVQALQREIEQYKRQLNQSAMYTTGIQSIAKWVAGISSDVLLLFDAVEQHIVHADRNVGSLLGYEEYNPVRSAELEKLLHPDDAVAFWAVLREMCAAGGRSAVRREIRLRTADGLWQWCTVWGAGALYAETREWRFVIGGLSVAVKERERDGE